MDVQQRAQEIYAEVEQAALGLFADLKYPVDRDGNIVFLNYLHPDVLDVIVHHLTARGYRVDPAKQTVKPRKVVGPGIPDDLVTYVPMDGPDEPLVVQRQAAPKPEGWSVRPQVNQIYEQR